MIPAIVIGRKNSKGFANKNKYLIKDHPMMAYPITAAIHSKYVNCVYFSTDDIDGLGRIAEGYMTGIIDRPKELATDDAKAEDVFVHAYNWINDNYVEHINLVVLMFANAIGITSYMIDEMIEILLTEMMIYDEVDSICTLSKYNMFSPYRARKIVVGHPGFDVMKRKVDEQDMDYFVHNFDSYILNERINCNRDSGTDAWFYDCCCAVVRPRCLENIEDGMLPQKWLGKNIIPYTFDRDIPCLDIDYEWQVPQMEKWIEKYWKQW